MTKRFAIIGVAGYIAPRHLKAIKDVGGELVASFDINDSVGIMDSYFPDATFFTEFESFATYLSDCAQEGAPVDYVAICSPNYLHKSHIAMSLRMGSDVICEKPLVLNPEDIDDLKRIEAETGKRVFSILQLRLHKSILDLKVKIANSPANKVFDVDLGYFTSRGNWYHSSWKGFEHKSGGIATNIGVHFYDMLGFVFGELEESFVHHRGEDSSAGFMKLELARVRWVLSINRNHLPPQTPKGQSTYRSITVDGHEIEFSSGFTELHTKSYESIIEGAGYGLDVVRPSIELVSRIRVAPIEFDSGMHHPDLNNIV